MDAKTRFHRTFLPFYKYANSDCNYSSHTPSQSATASANNRISQHFDRFKSAGAFDDGGNGGDGLDRYINGMQRGQGVVRKPNISNHTESKFPAFQLIGNNMVKTFIVEKPQQNFAGYATDWERQHSVLLYKVASRQSLGVWPIIDNEYMVIGHYVRARGTRFKAPQGANGGRGYLDDFLENDVPVFVSSENEAGWESVGATEIFYHAIIGIDGQVLTSLKAETVSVQSVDFWLLDVLEISAGVAGLGVAMARAVVKSLARKAAKRAGKTVVRELTGMTAQRAKAELSRQAGRQAAKALPPARYIPETGMTRSHFDSFRRAAAEEDLIAIVRNTNTQSTRWIELGYPAKPLDIKFNTDPGNGIVRTRIPGEIDDARKKGFWVVDDDGVARTYATKLSADGKKQMMEMDLKGAQWPVQPGQVIDPVSKKPFVGDYDLMAVVNPKNPGQNISLHASNKTRTRNISNPEVDRFQANVNLKMKEERVMHGAQDNFGGFKGGATVFHPNGDVVFLRNQADVEAFYRKINRQTQKGSYARPGDDVEVVDELAAMRKKKAAMKR